MAQPIKVGSEFSVNAPAAGTQNVPWVTYLKNGSFVVSWVDAVNGSDVRMQVFSAEGIRVGAETTVHTNVAASQNQAKVTALENGNFIVNWTDTSNTFGNGGTAVAGQIFSPVGTPIGANFLLSPTSFTANSGSVTALADGGFLAAYALGGNTVLADIFSAQGTRTVTFVGVANPNGAQSQIVGSRLNNGFVALVWQDSLGDSSGPGIRGRVVTSSGGFVSGEFLVNSTQLASQSAPSVAALAGGGFVVTWTDPSAVNEPGSGIRGQLFDAVGNRTSGEFIVNRTVFGNQTSSSVRALADGGFIVTWVDSSGTLGDPNSVVVAQRFDINGTAIGAEIIVGSLSSASQLTPSMAVNGAEVVIVYGDTLGDGADAGIRAQRLRVDLPVADTDTTTEAAAKAIAILANDGGLTAIDLLAGQAAAVGTARTLASGATVTLNADGTVTYNPNGAFNYLLPSTSGTGGQSSATDSFTYGLNNGSTATVTVTITGLNSADDQIRGAVADDTIVGTADSDVVDLSQGGADQVNAGSGNDGIFFGAAFGAGDVVNGGDGNDQLALRGNYSAGVTLTSSNLTNVEVVVVQAGAGAAYVINTDDTLVATGASLTFYASLLAAGQNFTLNAGSEADGTYLVYGGAGTDIITTGGGNDGALFGPGKFDPSVDRVNLGGGTNDQLALDGDYTLTLDGTSIQNVEVIVLLEGTAANKNDFNLTIANSFVPAGQTRTINGNVTSAAMTVNGSGETDGNLVIMGGRAGDTLTGGSGADILSGGGGGDTLTGGAGADIFRYGAVSQSTSTAYDRITDFVYGTDTIDLPGTYDVFTRVTTGTLNSGATFDTDLQSALAGLLNVGGAVVFTASAGTLSGVTFVVVDANGIAGYQGDQDYVIRVDGVVPGVIPDFIV
ncbi:MAG: calcium-binding protein [Pseudomonadota bacterium]